MDRKDLTAFELKFDESKPGTFTGIGSVYGNIDLQGDRVLPGAFTKSIAENSGRVPLLWQHDTTEPIGVARLVDSPRGLVVNGEIAVDTAEGMRAYSLLKKGVLSGLSIGYDTVQDQIRKDARDLIELKLWELSVVTFPANPLARVVDVKATNDVETALMTLRRNVLAVKAGRVLSSSNLQHVHGAMAHLDDAGKSHRAAMEHLRALHDAATAPAGDPDPDDPMDPNAKALSAAVGALRRAVRAARYA